MIDYIFELEKRGHTVKESGDSGYGVCNCPLPWHDDSDPSFSVSLKTGSFRCWGCGSRGDWAYLISILDDITLPEAREQVHQLRNMVTRISDLEKQVMDSLEDSKPVTYFSRKKFEEAFAPVWGTPVHEYLRAVRGITDEVIEDFGIRWVNGRKQSSVVFKYRSRAIIPIHNEIGLVAFTAHRINEGMKPKVLTYGQKSAGLLGWEQLRRKTRGKFDRVVLVEGAFDAMWLYQHGIAALGLNGLARLNQRQIRMIRKIAKTVVLCYDGDEAGQTAMLGSDGELGRLREHLPTWFVSLPDGTDPDDLTGEEIRANFGRPQW